MIARLPLSPHLPARCCLVLMLLAALSGCSGPNANVYRYDQAGPTAEDRADAEKAKDRALKDIDRGELERALPLLEAASRLDPQNGAVFNNLGWIHHRAGRLYPAAVAYRRAAELRPGDPVPLSNLGLVLGEAGRWDEAADLQQEAAVFAPNDLRFQTRRVYALIRRGDPVAGLRNALEQVVAGMREGGWVPWAQEKLAVLDESAEEGDPTR